MIKKNKRKIFNILIIIVLLSLSLLISKFIFEDSNHDSIRNERSTPGTISYGIRDVDNNIIKNGSTLSPINGQINNIISVVHNIEDERKYMLIVLKNINQSTFKINDKEHLKYEFMMRSNTKIDIPINIQIDKYTKELAIILIKKPEYQLNDGDIQKASILQEVISMRYNINNEKPTIQYSKPLFVTNDGPNADVFLSESKDELKVLYKAYEEDEIFLSIGNIRNVKKNFAVIALKDWEQVSLLDHNKVHFIEIPGETRNGFNLKLPKTNSESNYQILAFPDPYEVSGNNYSSQEVNGSIRLLIKPNSKATPK